MNVFAHIFSVALLLGSALSFSGFASNLPVRSLQAPLPQEILNFYRKVSNSCVSAEYSYTYRTDDAKITGEGRAHVQGSSFRLTMNGLEVISDGKSMWTVDSEAQEVMVDRVDDATSNLMANPILFVSGMESLFDVSLSNGYAYIESNDFTLPTYKVVMLPKEEGDVLFMDVHYARDFSVILAAVIYLKDGTVTEITIPSMTFTSGKSADYFTLDTSGISSDFIVTDLR